jgi:hypothetical protein
LATGAAADEYYIVQDASTRACTIVDSPPTTTQFVLLEKGKVFFDRDQAKEAAGSLAVCSSKTAAAVARAPGLDEAGRPTKSKARTAASREATGKRHQSARSPTIARSQSAGSGAYVAQSAGSRAFSSFLSLFR